jgi:hypothetical protein
MLGYVVGSIGGNILHIPYLLPENVFERTRIENQNELIRLDAYKLFSFQGSVDTIDTNAQYITIVTANPYAPSETVRLRIVYGESTSVYTGSTIPEVPALIPPSTSIAQTIEHISPGSFVSIVGQQIDGHFKARTIAFTYPPTI